MEKTPNEALRRTKPTFGSVIGSFGRDRAYFTQRMMVE